MCVVGMCVVCVCWVRSLCVVCMVCVVCVCVQNYDSDIKEMHAVTGNHRGVCLSAEDKVEIVQER